MWGKMLYREIAAPERLVFVNCFSDAQGNVTRPPFDQDWPRQILSTITFAGAAGRTAVTVISVPLDATEEEIKTFAEGMQSMEQGWSVTFEQLADHLAAAGGA